MARTSSLDKNPKVTPPLPLSLRSVKADAAGSQFPLTNIDNPNDIAQELSNLQALRRLSMDVGNHVDPDMPPMTLSTIPTIAPSGDDDENDPSRLLWVPARVHPELAPSEFKTFLEKRVQSIRRRSGEGHLSPEGDISRDSSGSLSRRKSMLSHQIDNSGGRGALGYVDGAERLERQKSGHSPHSRELSLEELVNDPAAAVQKLAQETQAQYSGSQEGSDDMPLLPMAPGMGLRRSTRTTYRKGGSLRSGERGLSRRLAQRQQDGESLEAKSPPLPDAPSGHGLVRVQSEPIHENYSRPNRSINRQHKFSQESPEALAALEGTGPGNATADDRRQPHQDILPLRTSSTSPVVPGPESPTSPTYADDQESQFAPFPQRSSSQHKNVPANEPSTLPSHEEVLPLQPSRSASASSASSPYTPQQQQQQPQQQQPGPPPPPPPPSQQYTSKSLQLPAQEQTLNQGLSPSPSFPGASSPRTDALTFIPTFSQDDKRSDKKLKKDREDDSSSFASKSSGAWKWLKSVADDKKKEEGKKAKTKVPAEKVQDNTRLDVLQTSIDKNAPKGRESLVLDRDSFDSKLQDERRKDSNRKSDAKKEKDGSIFSTIFGGSKKKEEKEKGNKKSQLLQVPEEPVYKPLLPDVDYNWTRFPLLEERAIYRMAHIKLANPRRPLLSQVLLSNFMYSYLAIVQAMHPQMNIPLSPQQKRLEEEARRKQEEEEYLAQQGLDGDGDRQDIDQYNFDYHRSTIQYAESGGDSSVDYVDDAQIYEDDHGDGANHGYDYDVSKDYGKTTKDYYQYREG
ncbi:hypothetical protein K4F52_006602 [Lecanicillium sp. MT-2017a]|nr:hypothetical protein K4F52_006602 [Lecanicillium sp. MT-2017a]